jgi:hypothetical protein
LLNQVLSGNFTGPRLTVISQDLWNPTYSSQFKLHILQPGIPRAPGYFRLPFMKTRMVLVTVGFGGRQDKNKNCVRFLLGNSPASEFYMPTFWNTLPVPSS